MADGNNGKSKSLTWAVMAAAAVIAVIFIAKNFANKEDVNLAETANQAAERVRQAADTAAINTKEAADQVQEKTENVAEEMKEKAQEIATEVKEESAEAAANAAEATDKAISTVAERANDAADKAGEKIAGAAEKVDEKAAQAADSLAKAADSVESAVAPSSAKVVKELPGGAKLNVEEASAESRLLAVVAADSAKTAQDSWIGLDKVGFASGASLSESSKDQLKNVKEIIAAYPAFKVKIGGYADEGDSLDAKLKLSKERAEAVSKELIIMGVDKSRLETQGFGAERPAADVSSPVAVQLTAK